MWRWPARYWPSSLGQCVAVLAGVAIVAVLVAYFGYRASGPAGLYRLVALSIPLALVAAPALVELLPSYKRWVDERTLATWQGRYYAFDDHQVRIAEARDELWFSTADVHAALDLPLRPHLLRGFDTRQRFEHPEVGDALSLAGLKRLLGQRTDATTLRFLRWAANDVHRPWTHRVERDALDHDAA